MGDVVGQLIEDYVGAGDQPAAKLSQLAEAVRDWLPFVSLCRFVPLTDKGTKLPALSELPQLQQVPKLAPLARLHDTGPPMPPLYEVVEAQQMLFRTWEGVSETTPFDGRQRVLQNAGLDDDAELRRR